MFDMLSCASQARAPQGRAPQGRVGAYTRARAGAYTRARAGAYWNSQLYANEKAPSSLVLVSVWVSVSV